MQSFTDCVTYFYWDFEGYDYMSTCFVISQNKFYPSVLPDEKKNVLSKKYNIAMTAELESEVQRMCNLSTAIENQGIKKGLAEGRVEGRVEGVDLMAKLVKILLAEKKYSDVEKASDDAEYRDKLLKEYKLVG